MFSCDVRDCTAHFLSTLHYRVEIQNVNILYFKRKKIYIYLESIYNVFL